MKRLLTILLAAFLITGLRAQETNLNPLAETEPALRLLEGERESIAALFENVQDLQARSQKLGADLSAAANDVERAEIRAELLEVNAELRLAEQRFQRIALSVDTSIFEKNAREPFDIKKELEQLVQPVISELKQATADSRALEELRQEKTGQKNRQRIASEAVKNLEQLLTQDLEESLSKQIEQLREEWSRRERDASNQLTAIEHQIEKRTPKKESVLNRSRDVAMNFFQSRGLHLFLGIGAFILVFLLMRGIAILYRKVRPERKKRSFGDRLGSLVWSLFTVIGAASAMMLVFNLTADWFLLSLTVIFLIGLGWAGFQTIPIFLEQFRLMLNLGAAKEGERMMWDEIPWRIESIGFVTKLVNPLLDGGRMVLPTRMIVGSHSRPAGENEEWFPCKQSDWVLLSDGTYGRVSYQTPSLVQVVRPGGSQKVYPTADFFNLHPQVLSTGFRIEVVFGIDPKHSGIAATDIPAHMHPAVEDAMKTRLGSALNAVRVELENVGPASIDYRILVDCKGEAADQWDHIPREISLCLMALATQNNWDTPRQQLTLQSPEG